MNSAVLFENKVLTFEQANFQFCYNTLVNIVRCFIKYW